MKTTITITTYTTAPETYDGFGTKTVVVAGRMRGGTIVRRVVTPAKHVQWQRDRYYSGAIFLVATEEDWNKHLSGGSATAIAEGEEVQ